MRVKYNKAIVALVIFLNTVFAAAVLYIFASTGAEPVVLIGAWFAFTTGELWLVASIKKKEIPTKEIDGNGSKVEAEIE